MSPTTRREELVARARRLFRMGLLRDTVAGMAFLWMPDLWLDVDVMTDAQLEPMFVQGYGTLLIVCLRFLCFRKQFRPLDADFAGPLVHPTFALARALARPSVFPFFVAALLVYFGSEARTGVVAVLGAVFAVYQLVAWWWRPDPCPTSGCWCCASSASTRTPPSRSAGCSSSGVTSEPTSRLSTRHSSSTCSSAGDAFAVWFWYRGHGPLAIMTTVLLAVAVEWRLLINRMDRSRYELQHRLARLLVRPRGHDLTFTAQPTPCFDDIWRMTVAEFTRISDIVLMDLRGFSAQRQDCAYELDFLFDTAPLGAVPAGR